MGIFTNRHYKLFCLFLLLLSLAPVARAAKTVELTRDELWDIIYGGWTGKIIGDLQGLKYEMKPLAQVLPSYTFGLPNGPVLDDDTCVELTNIRTMLKTGMLKAPYTQVAKDWIMELNDNIYIANWNARMMLAKGLLPPATGHPSFNKASWYNLSGQFCVESYGLLVPGMPATAADIGRHYAHISVWGEPIQAAQYWPTIVALAGVSQEPMEVLITQSLLSIDPQSDLALAIRTALDAYRQYPDDWKTAHDLVVKVVQPKWNDNATPSNGGLVALALLYGKGDIQSSIRYSYAFGMDADCNAATVGTILGARTRFSGIKKNPNYIMANARTLQWWALPSLAVAEQAILENGGKKLIRNGQIVYQIRLQEVKNWELLPTSVLSDGKCGDDKFRSDYLNAAITDLQAKNPDDQLRAAGVVAYYGTQTMIAEHIEEILAIFRANTSRRSFTEGLLAHGGLCRLVGDKDCFLALAAFLDNNPAESPWPNQMAIDTVLSFLRDVPVSFRPAAREAAKESKTLAGYLDRLKDEWK